MGLLERGRLLEARLLKMYKEVKIFEIGLYPPLAMDGVGCEVDYPAGLG